jgi:hypothetical protein
MKPIIHVYALTWNEHTLLPLFFKNYKWADKIVFLDYGSDEKDLKMMRANKRVEVRPFPQREVDDEVIRGVKNDVWKESRGVADWVIVQDFDEFSYNRNMPKALARLTDEGYTAVRSLGYDVVGRKTPRWFWRLRGWRNEGLDKVLVFNPTAIDKINYDIGAYKAEPTGRVNVFRTEFNPPKGVINLHFKMGCGVEYYIWRRMTTGQNLSKTNRAHGWGCEALLPSEVHKFAFETFEKEARRLLL